MPESNRENPEIRRVTSRRIFLATSGLLLAGCSTRQVTSVLPSPIWDHSSTPESTASMPAILPKQTRSIGAISRTTWAKGNPIPMKMNKMLPVKYITLHHDGMSTFTNTSKTAAASRLETIRRSHLQRDGGRWGDIGYHFAIDPSGRLWEARPLDWQGAHVSARNEGNVGVVVLGNFEMQSVNRMQEASVLSTLHTLMTRFHVPLSRVYTHQEWAATACPGRSLQKVAVNLRNNALRKI